MGLVSPAHLEMVAESAGMVETCVGVSGVLTVPIVAVITTSEATAKSELLLCL